jgi:hypothetical protein
MVPCCLLESRVLPEKGTGVPEGDFAQCGWVRDTFPLEKSWLYSTVVDPRSTLCYFNCCGGKQNNNRRPLQ